MIAKAVDAEVNRHTHHLYLLSAQKEPCCSHLGSIFTNKALIFISAALTTAFSFYYHTFWKIVDTISQRNAITTALSLFNHSFWKNVDTISWQNTIINDSEWININVIKLKLHENYRYHNSKT